MYLKKQTRKEEYTILIIILKVYLYTAVDENQEKKSFTMVVLISHNPHVQLKFQELWIA